METHSPIALPRPRILIPIIGLVVALCLIAFGRTLHQDFAPLDDDLLITHNLAVRGVTVEHLKTVFTTFDPELYIPLTFVSYQVNYMIAGLEPWSYHLTNILLHAGNALLVMWLLLLLTKKKSLALIAGLLFAVHPLNTEAVAWLAGRKDLLSTFFFLASFIAYIKYRGCMIAKKGAACRAPTYGLSVIFFLLALLSKVMAVTLPAILIAYELLVERKTVSWKILVDKIPFALLSGIFFAVATLGKERILSHHGIVETSLMAAKSTTFYLLKFITPFRLGTFYPYHGDISILLPAFFIPVLILLFLLFLLFFLHRKTDTHISYPILFGALFFLIVLSPTFINFHKGGEMYFASDRYPYLPNVGLLFLLVLGIAYMIDYAGRELRAGTPALIAKSSAVVLVLFFTFLSFQQTKIWDSAQSLFAHTLNLYPQSVAARVAIASMERREGRYDEAIHLLRDGLGYENTPELRMALGTVYAKQGRVDDAADQFKQAFALDPTDPEPLVGLGVLDEYKKDVAKAMDNYRRALALDPSYVEARNKLGSLLLDAGNIKEAEAQFREALKWNPNTEGILYNMSIILDKQSKPDEALADLERANELAPDTPMIMTALGAHLLEKDPDRSRALLEQVLRMDPGNEDARKLLRP